MKNTFQIISLLFVVASMFLLVLGYFNGNVTRGAESLTQTSPSDLPEGPTGEVPSDLMAIPEVPMGTIAAIIVCFFALLVSQRKHAAKLQ